MPAQTEEALGSVRGREGYDLDVGRRRLENPLETIREDLEGRSGGFATQLLVKLAERNWLQASDQIADVADGAAASFFAKERTSHLYQVLGIALGRLCAKEGKADRARRVWNKTWESTKGGKAAGEQLTIYLIGAQALAHLERHDELRGVIRRACEQDAMVRTRFGLLQKLEDRELCRQYLDQFTFLYR